MGETTNVEKKTQDLSKGAVVKSSTLSEAELKNAQQKVDSWSQEGYSTMAILFYLTEDYLDHGISFYIEKNTPVFKIA